MSSHYSFSSHQSSPIQRLPGQDVFVKLVTLQEKKEEQVQMKCWAGWASEDKMRDTLKIKELGSQVGIGLAWKSQKQIKQHLQSEENL